MVVVEASIVLGREKSAPKFSSYLELSQSEATTGADAAVVLDGRASDNRSELVDRARGQSGGLGLTSSASSRLLTGLDCIQG